MGVSVRYEVGDVPTATAFYVDLLGFGPPACRRRDSAVVHRGDLCLHLETQRRGGVPAAAGGRAHAGNRVRLTVPDLEPVVTRLRCAGAVMLTDPITDEHGRWVLVLDPSGNPVELIESAHLSAWVVEDHMQARVRARQILDELPRNGWQGKVLFAAAAAQRAFFWHDDLPADEQRDYSETWRPVLDTLWEYAGGDYDLFATISQALAHFYLSPQHHNQGQDGPSDADNAEVAATIYAAECALHGMTEFAVAAGARALDALVDRWDYVDEERLATETQHEVRRQAEDLNIIHQAVEQSWRDHVPREVVHALRSPP